MLRLAAFATAGCCLLMSCAQRPPTGTPVEYFLYTHCGIGPIRLGGATWSPVTVDGDGTGLDDYERGTLTVVSPRRILFESGDLEVELEPGPDAVATCR